MKKSKAEFLYHEPCDRCGSEDNLARYSDGSAFCFGCGHVDAPDILYKPPKDFKPRVGVSSLFPKGEYGDVDTWRVKEETCRKFGYTRSPFSGGSHIAALRNKTGEVVGQHVRLFNPKKSFLWRGEKDGLQLFGQHAWTTKSGPKIVICEGAKDTLCVSQNSNNKWPVVGIVKGAGNAAKEVANNLQWLLQFQEVILMFDADKAGQDAAIEVASLFPPNRCKIAKLPEGTDAADLWLSGEGHLITEATFRAEGYRPVSIYTAKEVSEQALIVPTMGASWPWKAITEATYGRHDGQVIVIGAGVGSGKTTFITQMQEHDLFALNVPIAVFHSEQLPAETVQHLAGMRAKKILINPDSDKNELKKYVEEVAEKPLFLFDDAEDFSWDTIEETARYLVAAHGVKHIYLDNLTSVIAHEEDKNKALQALMKELTLFAKATGTIWHVVSHLTTPDKGSHEEGARVTARQFYGSRAIAQWPHAILGLERDQQSDDEDEQLTMSVRFLKYRLVGARANGKCFDIKYDLETGKYGDVLDALPVFEPINDGIKY